MHPWRLGSLALGRCHSCVRPRRIEGGHRSQRRQVSSVPADKGLLSILSQVGFPREWGTEIWVQIIGKCSWDPDLWGVKEAGPGREKIGHWRRQ